MTASVSTCKAPLGDASMAIRGWMIMKTGQSKNIRPFHLLTGRCPKGVPHGAWEVIKIPGWIAWMLLSPSVITALLAVFRQLQTCGYLKLSFSPTSQTLIQMSVLTVLCAVVLGAIPVIRVRSFRRRLRKDHGYLCTECGYRLTGLPSAHACPECGLAFERHEVLRIWCNWCGDIAESRWDDAHEVADS